MPGGPNSSYARTAHTLLTRLQGAAEPIPDVLPQDHFVVPHLDAMNFKTISRMMTVLRIYSLEQHSEYRGSNSVSLIAFRAVHRPNSREWLVAL